MPMTAEGNAASHKRSGEIRSPPSRSRHLWRWRCPQGDWSATAIAHRCGVASMSAMGAAALFVAAGLLIFHAGINGHRVKMPF